MLHWESLLRNFSLVIFSTGFPALTWWYKSYTCEKCFWFLFVWRWSLTMQLRLYWNLLSSADWLQLHLSASWRFWYVLCLLAALAWVRTHCVLAGPICLTNHTLLQSNCAGKRGAGKTLCLHTQSRRYREHMPSRHITTKSPSLPSSDAAFSSYT